MENSILLAFNALINLTKTNPGRCVYKTNSPPRVHPLATRYDFVSLITRAK